MKRNHPFTRTSTETPVFVTLAQLMDDTKTLAAQLPSDTSLIVGIARSGLAVASTIGMLLHLPVSIFRQSLRDVVPAGHGWRMSELISEAAVTGSVVVIDDTSMSGQSFRQAMPEVRKLYPDAISASVYVNPQSRQKPDLWVRELPHPHLLEWNILNSVFSTQTAVDFDGILCQDCTQEQDDDGERYLDFLQNVKPLYPARRMPIPLIVTARLEKYRPQTVAWLERHRIRFDKLVMGPWRDNEERARRCIATYKAEHFKEFMKIRFAIKPTMFMESDRHQAQKIAHLSGGVVVCPAAGRCYP